MSEATTLIAFVGGPCDGVMQAISIDPPERYDVTALMGVLSEKPEGVYVRRGEPGGDGVWRYDWREAGGPEP